MIAATLTTALSTKRIRERLNPHPIRAER